MPTSVEILDIVPVTHNVRHYTLEKPEGFTFEPGQATEVSIDKEGWRDKKRPFTFTSLPEWDHLEFIAILRRLHTDHHLEDHRLIASHRTAGDIILRDEFESMRGLQILWTVTDDPTAERVEHQRIDEDFLKRYIHDISQNFYICGPDPMVKDIRGLLEGLGATTDALTWEK